MVSTVIPTLNEALFLPETLRRIRANAAPHEVIVVDGGSGDNTLQVAASTGCRVLRSDAPNRARQMNLGAQQATGDILFFLHADTWIGPQAIGQIEKATSMPGVAGGGFRRRYLEAPSLLGFTCFAADLRSLWLGWHLGDQGIFVRRDFFEKIGGFGELPIFEDLDFCRRLSRVGRLVSLGPPVLSSPRRFQARGAMATSLFDFWLICRYLAGSSPEQLATAFSRWKDDANRRSHRSSVR